MMARDDLDRLLITVHLGTQEGRTKAIGDILAHDAALRQQLEAETVRANCASSEADTAEKEVDQLRTELAAVRQECTKWQEIASLRISGDRKWLLEHEQVKQQLADLQGKLKELDKAVEKFLNDTNAIPPWESAGAIWAQRMKELQLAWLDARDLPHSS